MPKSRKKTPKHGINQVDGLYLPYTEGSRPVGPRGGHVTVMAYWGQGYGTWDEAKRAMKRGPDAEPLSTAVAVDTVTGKRLAAHAEKGGR